MAINVNMTNWALVHENILQTGNIHLVINYVGTLGDEQQKLQTLLTCLSQTLSSKPTINLDKCETALKGRIYALAKDFPETARNVIDTPAFKNSRQLSEVVAKVNYLTKGCQGRFWHHLQKNLGNLHLMTKGAAFFVAGVSMLGLGLNKFYPDDPTKPPNKPVGRTLVATGLLLTAAPFVSAALSAREDNP